MPPFKNNILSRLIIFVLFVEAVSIFSYLGFSVYKILFFSKMLKGMPVLSGETRLVASINQMAFKIIIGIVVLGILLFLCWLYRLYRNIESARNETEGFTPFTRVLALAIPIVNLFIPAHVINEICNAYTTDVKTITHAKRVINKWRFFLSIIITYSLYCIFVFHMPASANDVIKGIYHKIFLLMMCIHFSFITMEIVEMINEMERKREVLLLQKIA